MMGGFNCGRPIPDRGVGLLINIRLTFIMKPVDSQGKALGRIAGFSSQLSYNVRQQENSSSIPSLLK